MTAEPLELQGKYLTFEMADEEYGLKNYESARDYWHDAGNSCTQNT